MQRELIQSAVEMTGITKTFGKVTANSSVDFTVQKGEIHALVGENGAGKSTLMKILYGMHSPDSGKIKINGKEKIISSPAKAIKLGIGMVHQHFMLVNPLTVTENIILGGESRNAFGLINIKRAEDKINKLTKDFNIDLDIGEKIETLPIGLQQKVEILKILYRDAEILILDEPTAVLTPQETDALFNTLKELKTESKTIILITHKLDEVMTVSDSVTVLRHGKVTGVFEKNKTSKEEIVRLMVGEDITEVKSKSKSESFAKKLLIVNSLTVLNDKGAEAVKNISFTIRSGEILGIAGVEGNGQTELVEAITSLREIQKGEISIEDQFINLSDPAHIPANRHKNGIVLDLDIPNNILLGRQHENIFSRMMFIKKETLEKYTSMLMETYDIRLVSPLQKIKELSGGNQQKVVVAREMSKDTDLIIANHPTRGLDIKAANFAQNSLIEAKNNGKAVLLVSSDLNELLKLSDRIAVFYKGTITAFFDSDKTNEWELGMYMTGAK
jgi:ABC-type uncharacterized transport system ATPase subunit